MNQYIDSYSSAPAQVISVLENKIGVFDQYFLMQTGQYVWTAWVKSPIRQEYDVYTFTRGNQHSYSYFLSASSSASLDANFSNEMYVYSNMGLGGSLTCSQLDYFTAYSSMAIICIISIYTFFRVLKNWKWFRR